MIGIQERSYPMKKFFTAPGPNELAKLGSGEGKPAGFWKGVWHGFTVPFTFFISLFNPKVNIYEVHNNGAWYNFGYIIGLSMIFGGGKGGSGIRINISEQKKLKGKSDRIKPLDY